MTALLALLLGIVLLAPLWVPSICEQMILVGMNPNAAVTISISVDVGTIIALSVVVGKYVKKF